MKYSVFQENETALNLRCFDITVVHSIEIVLWILLFFMVMMCNRQGLLSEWHRHQQPGVCAQENSRPHDHEGKQLTLHSIAMQPCCGAVIFDRLHMLDAFGLEKFASLCKHSFWVVAEPLQFVRLSDRIIRIDAGVYSLLTVQLFDLAQKCQRCNLQFHPLENCATPYSPLHVQDDFLRSKNNDICKRENWEKLK